jgi:chemotaxis family two-component system response regulator Rcp1
MEAQLLEPALIDILVVESNPAEARLIAEGFRDAGHTRKIEQLHNAEDALSYLLREPPHQESSLPDLILLDLSLPRKSGFELLEEIRRSDTLKCIPVIVLSGSADPIHLRRAYELQANCYIRKPNDLDEFLSVIKTCYQFWGRTVHLPPKTRPS